MFLIYRSELQGIKSGSELFFSINTKHCGWLVVSIVKCDMYITGGAIWYIMSPRYNIQHIMECGLYKVLSDFNSLLNTSRSRWYNIGGAIRYMYICTITYWICYIMDCLLNVMILTLHWIPVAPGGNPCNPRNQNKWVFKDREKGETGGFDSRLRWRYAIK